MDKYVVPRTVGGQATTWGQGIQEGTVEKGPETTEPSLKDIMKAIYERKHALEPTIDSVTVG